MNILNKIRIYFLIVKDDIKLIHSRNKELKEILREIKRINRDLMWIEQFKEIKAEFVHRQCVLQEKHNSGVFIYNKIKSKHLPEIPMYYLKTQGKISDDK